MRGTKPPTEMKPTLRTSKRCKRGTFGRPETKLVVPKAIGSFVECNVHPRHLTMENQVAVGDPCTTQCDRKPRRSVSAPRSTFVAMIFCISVGAEERLARWRPLGSLHAVCTGLWKALARENSFVLMLVNFQPSSLRAPHMPSLCFIVGQQACTNTPKLRGRSCGRSHSIPSCVPGVFISQALFPYSTEAEAPVHRRTRRS